MSLSFAILRFALIIPAIVLHEVAHGYVAYRLGDTTAKDAGRLTLNPLKHIDVFGTLILPAILIAVSGVGFGYAKPVPINPYRFRDYRKGLFLTGIAGPTTNLALAAISGLLFRLFTPDQLLSVFAANLVPADMTATTTIALVLWMFASVNLVLLFFNLIPIPPLDGSRVIPLFLSDAGMRAYHKVEQYGFVILLGLLWVVPTFSGVDPISVYFRYTVVPMQLLLTGLA